MLGRSFGLAVLFSVCVHATTITTFSDTFTGAESTQNPRMFRDGIASDWSSVKPFPGTSPVLTLFKVYFIPIGLENYLQISTDDPNNRFFVAAYQTSYTPPASATNYLGDAGTSGNPTPVDPRFFNVIAAQNSILALVVMEVGGANGTAVGFSFNVLVEGFLDQNYTELPAVPEPATIGYSAVGLLLVVAAARKRRSLIRRS